MKTKKVSRVQHKAQSKDEQIKSRILEAAEEAFAKYGFSRVSMDELSSRLGMSKATLYRYFPSKEEILREIILGLLRKTENGVDSILEDVEKDFVQKLTEMLNFFGLQLARMGVLVTPDIQRNVPEIWKEIEEFRKEKILVKLNILLGQGIQSGIFRSDFDLDFLVLMYITLIQNIMNPATLVHFSLSFSEAFEMILRIVLEGILAEKGRARYFAGRKLTPKKGKQGERR